MTVYPLLWDGFHLSVVNAEIILYITGQSVLRTHPSILTGCLTWEPQPEFITAWEIAADVQVDRRKINFPLVQPHYELKCVCVSFWEEIVAQVETNTTWSSHCWSKFMKTSFDTNDPETSSPSKQSQVTESQQKSWRRNLSTSGNMVITFARVVTRATTNEVIVLCCVW